MDVPDMAVRAWRTVMEMLHDRSLRVPPDEEANNSTSMDDHGRSGPSGASTGGSDVPEATMLTVPGIGDNEIHRMAKEMQTFAVAVPVPVPVAAATDGAETNKHVVVFHTAEQTLKKEDLVNLVTEGSTIILVISAIPSGASRKSLETAAAAKDSCIEFFTLREMQYNVTRHECVPRHTRMTAAQEDEVIRRYRLLSRFQFHIILTSDPVARYLGLKHGNIVKIERHSPTSGTSINYRCCRSVASGSYVSSDGQAGATNKA